MYATRLRPRLAADSLTSRLQRWPVRPPRIGIAGSAGVGKSTLSLTVGATLGLPVVQEPMRARLESGHSLHGMSRTEHSNLLRSDAAAICSHLDGNGGFVSDRTPVDYLAFWFCSGYGGEDAAATERFAADVTDAMKRFDLVLVLPWAAVPLVDDGVRSVNPWHQLHVHTMIEGLCRRYVEPERLAVMPGEINQPDARCRWLLGRLDLLS